MIIIIHTIYIKMISKLWQTILAWTGLANPTPLPIIKRGQKKQRFLIIDDPYQHRSSTIAPSSNPNNKATSSSLPKTHQQFKHYYKLTSLQKSTQPSEQQKQSKQSTDFIFDLSEMNQVLREIQNKQKQILSTDQNLTKQILEVLSVMKEVSHCQLQQKQMYTKYTKIVQDTLAIKYSGEKKDYPDIQYEKFKSIYRIWKLSDRAGQNLVPGYDHLRFCHLKLLAPTRWLNDEVITQYINLMNSKLSLKPNNNYVILNSLKVTTLFQKTDYKKLQKVLQRQKVSRNTTLILAIHKTNHWLFVSLDRSSFYIYDSLMAKNLSHYTGFDLISKILKFAEYYYGSLPELERVTTFPQQRNGHDCGMMMLCGMKDVVRDRGNVNWSFCQNDINYKRALTTIELVDKNITGF